MELNAKEFLNRVDTAFEACLPVEVYSKINHYVLSVLFFPALIAIALYEKHWGNKHSEELNSLIQDEEDEVSSNFRLLCSLSYK